VTAADPAARGSIMAVKIWSVEFVHFNGRGILVVPIR
jgi:hypothetical protein